MERNFVRFLSCSDFHYHHKPPYISRTGNYKQHLENKTKEIIQIAHEYNVDAILVAGDIYHSPNPTYGISNAVEALWSKFKVPIYVSPGNHDLLGHEISSLDETALGSMVYNGLVHVFGHRDEQVFINKNGVTVQLSGTPYKPNTTPEDLIIRKNPDADIAIHLIHHMLILQKYNDKVRFVSVEEIADTEADLTICGHNHIGFDPVVIENKLFMCNGSISRLRLPERIHQPKVTIYDVYRDSIKYQHIYLTQVPYAQSIFIEGHIRRTFNKDLPNTPIFLNKRDEYRIATDIPQLLTDNARKLGLEHVLNYTLSTFAKYKQRTSCQWGTHE